MVRTCSGLEFATQAFLTIADAWSSMQLVDACRQGNRGDLLGNADVLDYSANHSIFGNSAHTTCHELYRSFPPVGVFRFMLFSFR